MPENPHIPRFRGCAAAALLLFLAACLPFRPGTAHALGGPWPIAVTIEGEVRRPGSYTLPPDATLSSLILAAGGMTGEADPDGAALFRVSARAGQERELATVAEEIARECVGPDGACGAVEPANALNAILAFLRELRPAGRIPVRVTHPRLMKNSPDDLRLEEGDTLRIPPRAISVAVGGAVKQPAETVPFLPGAPFEEYIRRVGGYAGDADSDRVYLLRRDGAATLLTVGPVSWNPKASRWEATALTGSLPVIGPGDAIIVFRVLPPGLPRKAARQLRRSLARAIEICGTAAVPPGTP